MKLKKTFLPENELVIALKNQELIGMQALNDMYSVSLGGVISKNLKDTELSKDVLQEVIIRIWDTAYSYETRKGRLFTWMINVARNYSIDILRSKGYRNGKRNIQIDYRYPIVDGGLKVNYNLDTLLIKELMNGLNPEFAILLNMVYFKGYTHVEVADELNMPLGTVKTRIKMAILKLRYQFN